MITAAQMRAARALLGIDQQTLADLAGVSLPTIQRMEASEGNVRGVVETLTKVVTAFDRAGVELIAEDTPSAGHGRGVRFKAARADKNAVNPSTPTRKKGRITRSK
jgi:transcriptional regulator with XRE-family HTH domain